VIFVRRLYIETIFVVSGNPLRSIPETIDNGSPPSSQSVYSPNPLYYTFKGTWKLYLAVSGMERSGFPETVDKSASSASKLSGE